LKKQISLSCDGEDMTRTVITPLFVLFLLLASLILMACSDIFDPVVGFIHNGTITPLQAGACLVFTVAGFSACYSLLNLLCSYFVPRMNKESAKVICKSKAD